MRSLTQTAVRPLRVKRKPYQEPIKIIKERFLLATFIVINDKHFFGINKVRLKNLGEVEKPRKKDQLLSFHQTNTVIDFHFLNTASLCVKNSNSFRFQEAKKVAFMVFVAVCITFQAIISDIYVYNKKAVAPKSTIAPTTIPVNLSSIATIPH